MGEEGRPQAGWELQRRAGVLRPTPTPALHPLPTGDAEEQHWAPSSSPLSAGGGCPHWPQGPLHDPSLSPSSGPWSVTSTGRVPLRTWELLTERMSPGWELGQGAAALGLGRHTAPATRCPATVEPTLSAGGTPSLRSAPAHQGGALSRLPPRPASRSQQVGRLGAGLRAEARLGDPECRLEKASRSCRRPPPPRQSWCSVGGSKNAGWEHGVGGRPDPCCGPPAAFPHPPGAPRGRGRRSKGLGGRKE